MMIVPLNHTPNHNSMLFLFSLSSDQQPQGNKNVHVSGGWCSDDFSHWVYSPPTLSNSASNNSNTDNSIEIEDEKEEGSNNNTNLNIKKSSILFTNIQPLTSIHQLLERGFFLTQKAKDSTVFGILISNLSQQYLVNVVKSIQQLITPYRVDRSSSSRTENSFSSASGRLCCSFVVGGKSIRIN